VEEGHKKKRDRNERKKKSRRRDEINGEIGGGKWIVTKELATGQR
jgi:hypothetical protein